MAYETCQCIAADGHIESAVQQMMSMGYSNIGRALDAIHAKK